MYRVHLTKKSLKSLKKLDHQVQGRLLKAVMKLGNDPRPAGCRQLVDSDGLWRIRVGDYRITYRINDEVEVVSTDRFGHRSDIYK
ncbi:type II toxin-antitoxin system RelE family toxin [Neolewinella antarctica]|uniref:mRNA interferase RelE/StbE n=1 Tax=Neolewinella antarctica TaxID=442734 RepID=A0ABX0XFD9_9BACT|nr:mRNA interferase RelE/StbE [Neolewinella antarctica]